PGPASFATRLFGYPAETRIRTVRSHPFHGAGKFGFPMPPAARRQVMSSQDQTVTDKIDRKSTRLNCSHVSISYAVFGLKKKKKRLSLPLDSCGVALRDLIGLANDFTWPARVESLPRARMSTGLASRNFSNAVDVLANGL